MSNTNPAITVEISKGGPGAATKERRFATKKGASGSARVSADIYLDSKGIYRVSYNYNRGRAWAKGWRTAGHQTEAEAFVALERAWKACLNWLANIEPVAGTTATDAFSAQVASVAG